MSVIDKVAVVKKRRVKQNCQELFDGEIAVEIKIVINYLKSLKNQNYALKKNIYNAARYNARKIIFDKKRSYFQKKN